MADQKTITQLLEDFKRKFGKEALDEFIEKTMSCDEEEVRMYLKQNGMEYSVVEYKGTI